MNKYKDIINLEHPDIYNHPRTSMEKRAAQFAPFQALTGYEEEIEETERLVDKEIILTEDEKEELDFKLRIIEENINNNSKVFITHFIKDNKKVGGKYKKEELTIKKINTIKKEIIFTNKIIKIKNIVKLEGEIFNNTY